MREDSSPSCRSLSASCILSFLSDLPYSIIDFSHFHTALRLSFVFFIVFSLKSSFLLPLSASPFYITAPPPLPSPPGHPSPLPSSQAHVNWFSLCVMQMFGLVSVAFLDRIHFTFNKTDSDAVCSHVLDPLWLQGLRVRVPNELPSTVQTKTGLEGRGD